MQVYTCHVKDSNSAQGIAGVVKHQKA